MRPPLILRKRKLSNFKTPECPHSTKGRNHGPEFCADYLLAIFFFSNLTAKSLTEIKLRRTNVQNLKRGSLISPACGCQPANPPLRPLVVMQGHCVNTKIFLEWKGRGLALFAYPQCTAHSTSFKWQNFALSSSYIF